MNVSDYLLRIDYSGPVTPTLETLQHLHRRHVLSVPFENLTFHCGGQIVMDLPLIYDKIVHHRRGGICFENNGLFSWLLLQLGFKVTFLSAQVKRIKSDHYGPPYDHCVLMVTLQKHRWLCDVGFGSGFLLPLSMETNEPQQQDHEVYRLRREQEFFFLETWKEAKTAPTVDISDREEMLKGIKTNCWTGLYKFTLQSQQWDYFKTTQDYIQHSPSSNLYCKSLCTQRLPKGRITYVGRKLVVTSFQEGGHTTKHTIEITDKEIPGILMEKFGIVLTSKLCPKDDDLAPYPIIL